MGNFKAPVTKKNKTATPTVKESKEVSSPRGMEYLNSKASTFQLNQFQAAADDQVKGSRIAQLQSKSDQFTGLSRVAQLQENAYTQEEDPLTEASTRPRANASGDLNFAKAKWAEISGMLEDVRTARQKTDRTPWQFDLSKEEPINQEVSQTKTKGGATLARKMFSIEKDRKWNELTDYLKANGFDFPAEELVKKTNDQIYYLLANSCAEPADFLKWYKELSDIVNKYQKAEKVEATKGKKYDKISGGQSFLTEEEIKNHIDSFGNGLGAFISENAEGKINHYKTWGKNNNFVTTKNTIDSIIANANGKKDPWWAIEESLGFRKGMFKEQCPNKTFCTYIIEKNKLEGQLYEILRLPQATDDSSFAEEWIAGGFTKGNNLEGVIKALSKEEQVGLGVSPFDQLVTVRRYIVSDDGTIKII